MYEPKQFPALSVLPLAMAYVGYISLGTSSLALNTVGFYQVNPRSCSLRVCSIGAGFSFVGEVTQFSVHRKRVKGLLLLMTGALT